MEVVKKVLTQQIKISLLQSNTGQVPGLPKNPRLIKDDKYLKLLQSLKEDPEMLDLRELIVFPFEDKFIVIAGNMRLKAMSELGYKEAPCKILSADTPVEKLKAYTIKDNIGYGDHNWADLQIEWDVEQLCEWGLDMPKWSLGSDFNSMSDEDIDLTEDFDPVGTSAGLQRVVFIFDGKEEAESYLNSAGIKFVKRNMAWQVNMSTQSILSVKEEPITL